MGTPKGRVLRASRGLPAHTKDKAKVRAKQMHHGNFTTGETLLNETFYAAYLRELQLRQLPPRHGQYYKKGSHSSCLNKGGPPSFFPSVLT